MQVDIPESSLANWSTLVDLLVFAHIAELLEESKDDASLVAKFESLICQLVDICCGVAVNNQHAVKWQALCLSTILQLLEAGAKLGREVCELSCDTSLPPCTVGLGHERPPS